jgi:uncharacterized protein (DUF952 family)
MPSDRVYKICSATEWTDACRRGEFAGSADDRRDGFIHLSTAEQVPGTLERHFAGAVDLILATFEPRALGPGLRCEASTRGTLYPHLYGPLPTGLALATHPLRLGPDGRHILPEDF